MRIAFIFNSPFDVLSVFQKPLGGSESACTYLAIELAKIGNEVTIFSQEPRVDFAYGVKCKPIKLVNNQVTIDNDIVQTHYDVIVLKNGLPELAYNLKSCLEYKPKLVFWTGHAVDQPALQNLLNADVVNAIDTFVCVSNWQRESMIAKFNLLREKVIISRNAISPSFENLYLDYDEYLASKSHNPILAYTSTPFRGLNVLLDMFPKLYAKNKNIELEIFSSMQVYCTYDETDSQFHSYYEQARETTGINYHGSCTQPELASKLRRATILSYPNTFAETSCIAVMEAMAAGMHVVTTNYGALSETTLGYGTLIEKDNLIKEDASGFIEQLYTICQMQLEKPKEFFEKGYAQVVEMNNNHTWHHRAREWVQFCRKK